MTTVLFVLTSHDRIGTSNIASGNWLDSIATPYLALRDEAIRIVVASPTGGPAVLDPRGTSEASLTEANRRFKFDNEAQRALRETIALEEINPEEFDGLYYPGSYPAMIDLPHHPTSIHALAAADARERPIGMMCHSPTCLLPVTRPDGNPLIEGRHVTGFSRSEELGVGMDQHVPMLLEDILVAAGGLYTSGPDWLEYVVADGNLITGQNPASAAGVARELLERL